MSKFAKNITRKVANEPKPPDGKQLIKSLRKIEEAIELIHRKVFLLRDKVEFPMMLAEIQELIETKKIRRISSEVIMRRYDIGYARTARLMDELRERKLIK